MAQLKPLLDGTSQESSDLSQHLPKLEAHFNRIKFHKSILSFAEINHKTLLDVITWLQAVMITMDPQGDFDGDGSRNELDDHPFNN